ncbi:unnamed protein product [Rotaria magnacalcarata]|uniref:Uncharacterized protein n=1 Tax=Rotaria magnacalcarata TaxID=392030 RepID=A0A819TMH9_9BILA|nr:unnamed protein product [Rotaria magnacalcarata]CAF3794839.1 unnamed protein product [Rotaria magnacalcarata]CAF4080156.1 unnamed protein product [Rotaria magnacalcarata]
MVTREEPGCEFEFVWLGSFTTDKLNEPVYLNRKMELGNWVNHLHMFNTIEECLKYFAALDVADKVFFIISGSTGKNSLLQFHEQTQIVCIYIYCNDTAEHRDWVNGYSRKRGVYNRPEDREQIISAGELQQLKDNIVGVYSVHAFFSSSDESDVIVAFLRMRYVRNFDR